MMAANRSVALSRASSLLTAGQCSDDMIILRTPLSTCYPSAALDASKTRKIRADVNWRSRMKRIALCLLGVMAASTGAWAQASADIDKALLAAPANLREAATVIKWKPDFTYDTLKKGTNRLVCYDRSGFPGQQPFSIECTSVANLDRVAQNLKAEALGDKTKTQAMLDEMEKNGTRVK